MLLIADSGSTKTSWRWLAKGETKSVETLGLNPYHNSFNEIVSIIKHQLIPNLNGEIENATIFFYGAGCSTKEKVKLMEKALKSVFAKSTVKVEHDMLGAARAVCGNQAGLVAILGTGSNTCLYNGEKITENIPALGYVLGDEGSGAYLGKLFLKDYLHNKLPNELHKKADEYFGLSLAQILNKVYLESRPNRFLASFSKFIKEHKHHLYMQELIKSSFADFFINYITKYANYQEYKLNTVGSIGYVYKEELNISAENYGVKIGKVIKEPISELLNYHQNK